MTLTIFCEWFQISATGFGYKYPPGFPGEKPGFCGRSDVITDCSCRPENIVCRNDYECPFSKISMYWFGRGGRVFPSWIS